MSWMWLAGILLVALPTPTFLAAEPAGTARMDREPRYDPATVVNLQGYVDDIHENRDSESLRGLYLIVKTDTETVNVYLGPADFIRKFEISFRRGDQVQLAGSKVRYGGAWLVLAREVRRDASTLYLRDKEGRPYWEEDIAA